MTDCDPVPAAPTVGLTVYGCDPDEAALFRELAPRFGVAPEITELPPSDATSALAVGTRCVSVGHRSEIGSRALRALGRAGVEYLSTRSIGVNHIDVDEAERVGIAVGTVAYSPDSVADYTLMLILMALRDAKSVLRRVELHDYRLGPRRGRELRDLTVGVIGTGRIGTAVVDRLRGFGCAVVAHDRRPTGSVRHVSLDELLEASDVVTLHTPLDSDTAHLLDRRRIAQLKPGAVVVNTGRGGLLDTEALVDGLESGRLGGAALDVLEGEEAVFYRDCSGMPIASGPLARLQRLPNAIVSPHTAYYTDHALSDVVESTLVNCLEFERRGAHGEAEARRRLRGLLGRAPRLRQVGARGREAPRYGEV